MNPEYTTFITYDLINQYQEYTPQKLREMADFMESQGLTSFECECFYYNDAGSAIETVAKRLATPEEIEKKRLDEETRLAYTRARELEQLKKLQEKYG